MQNRRNRPGYSFFLYAIGAFLFVAFFSIGIKGVEAAPIKILNNSRHAYDTIISTIDQLLGRTHTSSEFVIHSTSMGSASAGYITPAFNTSTSYYNESGVLVPSQAPYQIYSSSYTGYPGDTVTTYNQYSEPYDFTDNYAFTASASLALPPTFHTAPGGGGWASAAGVEWTIDPAVFCVVNLSCLTAANAGIMAWLRFGHPTWNWFDVKAAMRQNGTNWATGYSTTTYGFGVVNATTTNALTDSQILLQPPVATVANSGMGGQLTFTIYPFRQTRRVKEVLFQFSSAPATTTSELTLAQIQTLGGAKITEYTSTTATTTTPTYTAVTNAYFVWFTADNSTDSAANFSRIDTYSVLGPVSQNQIEFSTTFDVDSPTNNAVSSAASPTFTWSSPQGYLGISKYQLFIDGSLNKDNISGTSATPTSNLLDGTHTWYIKAFNGNGAATTSVSTFTLNVVSGYSSGYTFYVDNVLGSDNNPGTQALPWATLSKAGLTASVGDTVIIIKNTGQPYRETLASSNNGTSGSPITFRGVDANMKPEIWGSDDISSGWSVYNGGNPNTYQKATTTVPNIITAGPSISNLTKKTWGSSASALNPGEWYWVSNVLYYRLASGEDISTLHVEASARNYIISNSKSYVTYKNLIARYANTDGVSFGGTGAVVEGIEVYDSYGVGIQAGSNTTVRYCVAARNGTYGIASAYVGNVKIYNCLMYGNGTSGFNFNTNFFSTNTSILKNNISLGNTYFSFSFTYFYTTPFSITSNNAWDIAGDSNWDTYKGTNNQELVDSLLVNPSSGNFALQQFSPNIDAGTNVGLTTDVLGNPIYGTPDIGPYEYQPPYTVSGTVPTTGSIRVYGNGKYRMTAATSSSATANMSITPVGGFPSGDYSEWLNVTVNSWNISGDYSKSWTESSSSAGATTHTVADLAPNAFYEVKVDGTRHAQFQTDGNGQGTFTYSGGYSTHIFTLTAVPAGSISIPSGGSGALNPLPPAAQSATTSAVVATSTSLSSSSVSIHASGLTTTQIQSILAVLTSFGVDSTTIAKVTLVLTGVPSTSARSTASTPPASSSCSFTRDLMIKMWGADIACLQRSLTARGYAIPAGATGYFGKETRAAVAEWQTETKISPAYGYFGVISRGRWGK